MKKSKFTEQQIAFALQQAEGGTRCGGVPEGGHRRSDVLSLEAVVRRADAVGSEEAAPARGRERTPAPDRCGSAVGQGDAGGSDPPKTMTPARGREMIDLVRSSFRVLIRRASRAVPARRATYHYRSRRPEQVPLRKRIREIAETRMRYGYRRITIVLRREGWRVNVKRVHRLYRRPANAAQRPRRRVMAKLRDDRSNATEPRF